MDARRCCSLTAKDSAMRLFRALISFSVLTAITFNLASPARACGPFTIDPIFIFKESPDLPFEEFTRGKLGIIKPTFGRKTLVIAYRYLNGGSFSDEEQKELVSALHGEGPEPTDDVALKGWIAARTELTPQEELPEIYQE